MTQQSLDQAITSGQVAVVVKLLNTGVSINEQDPSNGWTPLHLACHLNNAQLVQLLIEHGADSAMRNYSDQLPADMTPNHDIHSLLSQSYLLEPVDAQVVPRHTASSTSLSGVNSAALAIKQPGTAYHELEILVYTTERNDNYLLGAVFVPATEAMRNVKQRILRELDNTPADFTMSRHNGRHAVPISMKQMEQSVGMHFRQDDVILLTPAEVPAPVPQASMHAVITSSGSNMDIATSSKRPSSYDEIIKLLIVGDSGVGKSCLLVRFTDDSYIPAYVSTIGIDFKSRIIDVDNVGVKLDVWDTAGQERFRTITSAYYRHAPGAVIVYDVTCRASFDHVRSWYADVKQNGEDNVAVVMVGNKCEEEDKRVVSSDEGQMLAMDLGVHFFETSAKHNVNVQELFFFMARTIYRRMDAARVQPQGIQLTPTYGEWMKQRMGKCC
jgi:Ras-related protein Rab-8A